MPGLRREPRMIGADLDEEPTTRLLEERAHRFLLACIEIFRIVARVSARRHGMTRRHCCIRLRRAAAVSRSAFALNDSPAFAD